MQLLISLQGREPFVNFTGQVPSLSPQRFESTSITAGLTQITVIATRNFNQFGNDFPTVDNYAYLVSMAGKHILHTGDIDYAAETIRPLSMPPQGRST